MVIQVRFVCLIASGMRSGKRQLQLFSEAYAADSRAVALSSQSDLLTPAQPEQPEEARPGKGQLQPEQKPKQKQEQEKLQQEKLWICLHFPSLALAAVGHVAQRPAVIVAEQRSQAIVTMVAVTAVAAGIRAGMSLNAALALCPELEIYERDEAAEKMLLNQLAEWALGFSPVVSCVHRGLLLEVRSSLRLFGGLEVLLARLHAGLRSRGQAAQMAYAPTPRAALWLASANASAKPALGCLALEQLQSLLGRLPLQSLGWPLSVQRKLQQMGVANLADCLRLPRAGFARRIGPSYLRQLDQAIGHEPDIQSCYMPPVQFRAKLELQLETIEVGLLIPLCQELLAQLSRFLRQRQQGVRQLHVQLLHYQHAPTVVEIPLRDTNNTNSQVEYLFNLLCLRLERLNLNWPVVGVRLSAQLHNLTDSGHSSLSLLPGQATDEQQHEYLLERLRARLGCAQVYFVRQVAEHRPERAWQMSAQPEKAGDAEIPGELLCRPRPLWLLAQPRRLSAARGLPLWYGALTFAGGAERIESGWWDGDDIRRDYYVVSRQRGEQGWVFRDLKSQSLHSAWYLHGIFA
jgi:protein ImuB